MPPDPSLSPEPEGQQTPGVRVRPRGLKQLATSAAGIAAGVLGYVLVAGGGPETAAPDLPVGDLGTRSTVGQQTASVADTDRSASGSNQPTATLLKPKKVWWHDLRSTMCIRVPEDQGFINVTVVDCRAEHQAEVMGRAALSGPKKWPGDEAMDTMALQKCREAFEPYIGLGFDESALDMDYFTADREGWQVGDRTVVCLVFDPNDDGASKRALRGVRE